MNILAKLGFAMERKLYRYSKHVDTFINDIVNQGEIVSLEHFYAQVKYKGATYYIWMPDLSECLESNMEAYIYSHLRPSVKTRIRFEEWLEANSGRFSDRKEPLSVRKIERLISK